jgi:hypothetical protein
MTWLGVRAPADLGTAHPGRLAPSRHHAPLQSRWQKIAAESVSPYAYTRYWAPAAVDYPNAVEETAGAYCARSAKHGSCVRKATTRCGFRLARGCGLRNCAVSLRRVSGWRANPPKAKPPRGGNRRGRFLDLPATSPLSGRGGGEAQERFDHAAPDAVKAARAYGRINRASPLRLRPARGSLEPRHCKP